MSRRPRWFHSWDGMNKTNQAKMWRAAAAGFRRNGDRERYERAARTAAIIEGRPWRIDGGTT